MASDPVRRSRRGGLLDSTDVTRLDQKRTAVPTLPERQALVALETAPRPDFEHVENLLDLCLQGVDQHVHAEINAGVQIHHVRRESAMHHLGDATVGASSPASPNIA